MNETNPFQVNTFRTNNRQLAFALATAGCAFASQEEGGPAINIYTLETLRARGIGIGLTIEHAAKLAVERKIPGNVTYVFKRTEGLERCIKAWDATVQQFQKAAAESRDPVFMAVADKDIMHTLCVYANNSKQFAELPWFRDPLVMTSNTTSSEADGKTTTKGSAKIWSLGASLKLKNDLKSK